MSKTKSITNVNKSGTGWAAALQDAKRELAEAKSSAVRWREAIATIRRKIAKGEPWPGSTAAQ